MATKNRAPKTDTRSPLPITRCYCSPARAIFWRRSWGPATCTVPTVGKNCCFEIERHQKLCKEVMFRADAAFAKPEIYDALEERGVMYAIRIPANDSLERDIAELLTRPVGRPSHKQVVRYTGFFYQAADWRAARRVAAKVEFHVGELFPLCRLSWNWRGRSSVKITERTHAKRAKALHRRGEGGHSTTALVGQSAGF